MKTTATVLFWVCFTALPLAAQTPSVFVHRKSKPFQQFAIADTTLYTIDYEGGLMAWSLLLKDTLPCPCANTGKVFTAIVRNPMGEILLGTKTGEILQLHASLKNCIQLDKVDYPVLGIQVNALGQRFIAGPAYIETTAAKKRWSEFPLMAYRMHASRAKTSGKQKASKTWYLPPQQSMMDSRGRWWMLHAFGEFGGEFQVFDSQEGQVITADFSALPNGHLHPTAVVEDVYGNVYLSSGLMHYFTSGEIYRLSPEGQVRKIYDSKTQAPVEDPLRPGKQTDLCIGASAYDEHTHQLYIATQAGIYKAGLGTVDEPTLGPLQLVVAPALSSVKNPMAQGLALPVVRMEFSSLHQLVFLTQQDGIGVYDGEQLYLLK
jgi:hypothetical protein